MDTLEELRKSIDNIDNAIVAMFAERFKVTDRVGLYKAENQLPAKDETREEVQHHRIAELALQYGLEAEFAHSYLDSVIDRVVERHKKIGDKT